MTPETPKGGALVFFRTAIIVTFLSVLVWIVAEGESLSTERIEIVLRLVDNDADLAMRPTSAAAWTGRVLIDLEGSTAEVARLRDRLRNAMSFSPGDAGVPVTPGMHTLDIAEMLRQSDMLDGSGVVLGSVEPESVEVLIDQVAWRNFEIRVDVPELASASSPVANPAQVRVLVPSQIADQLADVHTLVASLSPEQVSGLQIGERNTIANIPIELPDVLANHPFVRIEPERVSVIVTLESRVDSITRDNVPVQVRRPAFEAGQWIVAVEPADQLLQGVTITGPSDLIELIRTEQLKIFATVVLTLDDLDAGITQKEATFFDLPTPLSFEAPTRTVRLTITPVAPAGTP